MDQPTAPPPEPSRDFEGATSPDPEIAARMKTMLAQIWRTSEATLFERIATIRAASVGIDDGTLDDERREQARAAAHKLAGVLGTFGLPQGTEVARQVEVLLESGKPAGPPEATRLTELLRQLVTIIETKSNSLE